MKTPKRPNPEFNAGAAYARAHILRALRRAVGREPALYEAITFVKGMAKRAVKRKGGAGSK